MPKIVTSKEELIEKSLVVFKETGYPATSMAMVAKACGVEKAHLYYYFKNKEDLMVEVLRHLSQRASEEIFSIAYEEERSYSERLELLLTKLENFYKEVKTGCLLTNTIIQTLYERSVFKQIAQQFCTELIEAVAYLYQERYSSKYANNKAEQAVQDLYGGLIFAQIYDDDEHLIRALKRIKKKI
jgi:AcrR family transcriptional regulator